MRSWRGRRWDAASETNESRRCRKGESGTERDGKWSEKIVNLLDITRSKWMATLRLCSPSHYTMYNMPALYYIIHIQIKSNFSLSLLVAQCAHGPFRLCGPLFNANAHKAHSNRPGEHAHRMTAHDRLFVRHYSCRSLAFK